MKLPKWLRIITRYDYFNFKYGFYNILPRGEDWYD